MADGADVQLHWGVRIPLRDGVRLSATTYMPLWQPSPCPCIVALTPYISDSHHETGKYFAARGFPFVVVDVRGRGNSEGSFRPFIQEARDGYDVVEWLARQPYCNGKVAMWGGSYLGYSQWATAKEFPPHLATIVPTAAPRMAVEFPMRNNIFYPFLARWLVLTSGRALQGRIVMDDDLWSKIFRKWYDSGRPFCELDDVLGIELPVLREWLAHPEPDTYWDAYNPTPEQCAALDIPILTITGSYDDDQPGALEHYRQHLRHASPAARARHYLIIGPWDHRGTVAPRSECGGVELGPASLIDMAELHVQWYAWTMLGGSKPRFLQKNVAYYVVGAERWRYADTLEQVTERHEIRYLDSDGRADSVDTAGVLGHTVGRGPPDSYCFDPREVGGAEIEAEARADAASIVDQSVTLALRGKSLVYDSAFFEQDLEVSGFFRVMAWISIDSPDTDLYAVVYETTPGGGSIRLATDAIRARYREGLRDPRLISTHRPLRYEFNRFTFVSREIRRGHALRLVIAPIGRLVEATFAQKNYQGGGIVAEESSREGRAVTVGLYHSQRFPSVLHVPVGRVGTSG